MARFRLSDEGRALFDKIRERPMNADIANTLAAQIDAQKPEHLVPGIDLGMEVREDALVVMVLPTDTLALITYDRGMDCYRVAIERGGGKPELHERVYCDMLGPVLFGDEARKVRMTTSQGETEEGFGEIRVFMVDEESGEEVP